MAWGIQCGKGWFKPIKKLSLRLEKMNRELAKKYKVEIHASQVKEKWGMLVFDFYLTRYTSWWKRCLRYGFYKAAGWIYKVKERLFSFSPRIRSILTKVIMWCDDMTMNLSFQQDPDFYDKLDTKVDNMIDSTIDECLDYCEICGKRIGTRESPRCETKGWISYICMDCANKQKKNYSVKIDEDVKLALLNKED